MKLGRRMFLKGSGGAALAIPCLTSLLPREARAAFVPPKRFVAISGDLGVVESKWYPAGYRNRTLPAGQQYTEQSLTAIPGSISEIIGPAFDALKPKLLLMRGLDCAIWGPQAGHMHTYSLTGTFDNGKHPGNSIDVVLGRSPKVKLPETNIAHVNCGLLWGGNHSYAATSTGSMKSTFMYPSAPSLFEHLFGGFSGSSSGADDHGAYVRRKTLLIDSVREHYRSVAGSTKLGRDDKRLLEEFLTGFSSLEQRVKSSKPPAGCRTRTTPLAPKSTDPMTYDAQMADIIDTAALALKCGIVQVMHICLPTPEDSRPLPASAYAVFKNLDTATVKFTIPIHNYSHNDGNAAEVNPIYNRWLASWAARFMTSLDVQESAESPATFLDSSLVMYNNNLSNGSSHLRYDLPVLLGGSLGGRFRTGRFLDYTQNVRHTIQNHSGKYVGMDYVRLLVAILQGFGLSEPEYQQPGQPPGFGSDARHGGLHPMLDTSKRREPLPGILA